MEMLPLPFFRWVQAAHLANLLCKVFSVLLPSKPFQYYVCLSHMFPLITQPVLDTVWCSLLCSDLNLFCVDKYKVHISTYKDESQEPQVTISWTPHFKCSIVFQFFETTVFELEMGSYLPCSALCSHMWHHCLGQRDTRARRLRRAPSFSNATAPPCMGRIYLPFPASHASR